MRRGDQALRKGPSAGAAPARTRSSRRRAGFAAVGAAVVALAIAIAHGRAEGAFEAPVADLAGVVPGVRTRVLEALDAVRGDPQSAKAWGRLGAVYEVHGFYDEAARCYARAADLDAADWRWPYFEGIWQRRSDQQEAARCFARALALRPGHLPLIVTAGETLLRLERLDEADAGHCNGVEALALARGLCETSGYRNPVVFDTLAAAAAETGDFKLALEVSGRAVKFAREGLSSGAMDPGLAQRMQARLELYYRHGRAYHGPP